MATAARLLRAPLRSALRRRAAKQTTQQWFSHSNWTKEQGHYITVYDTVASRIQAAKAIGRKANEKLAYCAWGVFVPQPTSAPAGASQGASQERTWSAQYNIIDVEVRSVPEYVYRTSNAYIPVRFRINANNDYTVKITQIKVNLFLGDKLLTSEGDVNKVVVSAGYGPKRDNGTDNYYTYWFSSESIKDFDGNAGKGRSTNAWFQVQVEVEADDGIGSGISSKTGRCAPKLVADSRSPTFRIAGGEQRYAWLECQRTSHKGTHQWYHLGATSSQAGVTYPHKTTQCGACTICPVAPKTWLLARTGYPLDIARCGMDDGSNNMLCARASFLCDPWPEGVTQELSSERIGLGNSANASTMYIEASYGVRATPAIGEAAMGLDYPQVCSGRVDWQISADEEAILTVSDLKNGYTSSFNHTTFSNGLVAAEAAAVLGMYSGGPGGAAAAFAVGVAVAAYQACETVACQDTTAAEASAVQTLYWVREDGVSRKLLKKYVLDASDTVPVSRRQSMEEAGDIDMKVGEGISSTKAATAWAYIWSPLRNQTYRKATAEAKIALSGGSYASTKNVVLYTRSSQ